MNHLRFIHRGSHKFAAPVCLRLSHMPKYPPSSGCFSHWSHQKNPTLLQQSGHFHQVYFGLEKKPKKATKNRTPNWLLPVDLLLRAASSLILLSIPKLCCFRDPFCSFDAEAKMLGLFLFCKHWCLVCIDLKHKDQWKEGQKRMRTQDILWTVLFESSSPNPGEQEPHFIVTV